jgi:hypothetical protein
VPNLRNLKRRLLRVERQRARPVETKIPLTLLRAALAQMDHADRQRLSELNGLTREQIRRRIADDREIRACARRAIGLVMRPNEQAVAGDARREGSFC